MPHATPTQPLDLAIAGQRGAPDTATRRYSPTDILAVAAEEPHAGRPWTLVLTRGNRGGHTPRALADVLRDLESRGWRARSLKVSDGSPILRDAAYQDGAGATVRLVDESERGQRLQITWTDCAAHLEEVRQPVEVSA